MKLTFLGATETVTGSRYLLEGARVRVLIDCGLFQGTKNLRLRNWGELPFSIDTLDAVILTHAHLDHSGYLPVLARAGYRGPVYCTSGTRDLCEVLLRDSAKLQEEEADFATRHGFSKHKPALPLYTLRDAQDALRLLITRDFDVPTVLSENASFRLLLAGHKLGAASVVVKMDGTVVTFSGDLGRPNDPIMRGAAPLAHGLPDRRIHVWRPAAHSGRPGRAASTRRCRPSDKLPAPGRAPGDCRCGCLRPSQRRCSRS